MPEGDTLYRIADVMRRTLGHDEIVAARGRAGGARLEELVGARVEAVRTRGKHLLIEFDDGLTLHTHLMMDGSWHRYRPGERWRARTDDAVAVLETGSAVAVCFKAPTVELIETRALPQHPVLAALGPDLLDPEPDIEEACRRLLLARTSVELIETRALSQHPVLAALGPDLLDPEPDIEEACRRLLLARTSVAEALLDQRVVAGIGNVYRSEVLADSMSSPFTPAAALGPGAARRILATAAGMLRVNLDGQVRGTVPGARRGERWVYGLDGRPCRRCGTPIVSRHVGRPPRRLYWCPACQPLTPASALPSTRPGTSS